VYYCHLFRYYILLIVLVIESLCIMTSTRYISALQHHVKLHDEKH
jgi:hypothetical protein